MRGLVARVGLTAAAIVLVACGIALSASTGKHASSHGPRAAQAPRGAREIDGDGAPAAARGPVTNRDLAYPTVGIHATPTTQARNQPISFSSGGSIDPDGSIASYFWDFGDGFTSTDPQPQHSYAFAGPKHVTLSVTDDEGLTSTAGTDVTITGSSVIEQLPGCTTARLVRNDDQSSAQAIPLGFTLNFFGVDHSAAWVNNNGNITFDGPLGVFTPFDLSSTAHEIVAPLFADVDTHGAGSARVGYGQTTVGGRPAFCVDWGEQGGGVGYFFMHADKLNRFQLLLVDRSDVAPGDFDIEMNYDQVQWETGDASDGVNGLGGTSARVGYSNGTGNTGTFLELPGSAINGALLDDGPNSLTGGSRGTSTIGRYLFEVRNGAPPTGGQIHGVVTAEGDPVAHAPVQTCPTGGGACIVTHTNASGFYNAAGLPAGAYTVTALPPIDDEGHRPTTAGPVTLPPDGDVVQDVALESVQGPPAGTGVTNIGTGDNGEPILYWEDPLTITTTGCPEGEAHFAIRQDGAVVRAGTMPLDHVDGSGHGVFVGHAAALYPIHGTVQFEIVVSGCSDPGANRDDAWDAYVDPSGTVQTTNGQAIAGAAVTLYRSDSAAGPFAAVPDGSDVMAPTNRRNPDVADARGHFGWDTLAGYYRVRAEAAGCHQPGGASSFVETGVLTIPPPVTNLRLTLDCGAGIDAARALSFAHRAVGSRSAAQTLHVANTGPGPLDVQAPTLGGPHASDFAVAQNGCAQPVPVGGGCDIALTFAPSGAGGRAATLSIASDGSQAPLAVALSGTGDASPGGGPVATPAHVSPKGCAARRGRARATCLKVQRALARCAKLKPRRRPACRRRAQALGKPQHKHAKRRHAARRHGRRVAHAVAVRVAVDW